MTEPADLTEVYAPHDSAQVVILKQLLAEEQIEVYVVNDGMEGVTGEVPFHYARPRIWVKTTDVARAREICNSFDGRLKERADGAPVNKTNFCYHCGEMLPEEALSGKRPPGPVQRCPSCNKWLD